MKQTSLKRSHLFSNIIINWSSIIGALGTLAFCIWPTFLASFNPKKPCQPLFCKPESWPPLFIFLQILQQWSYYSWCPDICRWCLYLWPIIGTIYNYIGIVIGSAIILPPSQNVRISSSNLWSVRRPTTSTLAGSRKASVRSLLLSSDDLAG